MKLKKLTQFSLLLLICTALIGCSKLDINSKKEPVTNFVADADVTMNNCSITCKVSRNIEALSEIVIMSPPGLTGMTFKCLGNSYSVSYQGLSCETEYPFLPDNSFAKAIINVLNETSKPESLLELSSQKDFTTYSGHTDSGEFKIIVNDSTGFIDQILFDDDSIKVKFSNYTLL